jgi:hypothetical protein
LDDNRAVQSSGNAAGKREGVGRDELLLLLLLLVSQQGTC